MLQEIKVSFFPRGNLHRPPRILQQECWKDSLLRRLQCLLKPASDFFSQYDSPLRIPEIVLDYTEAAQVKWHVVDVLRKQQDRLPGGMSEPELIKDIWIPSGQVCKHDPGSRDPVPYIMDDIAGPEQAICTHRIKVGRRYRRNEDFLIIPVMPFPKRGYYEAEPFGTGFRWTGSRICFYIHVRVLSPASGAFLLLRVGWVIGWQGSPRLPNPAFLTKRNPVFPARLVILVRVL